MEEAHILTEGWTGLLCGYPIEDAQKVVAKPEDADGVLVVVCSNCIEDYEG